VNLPFAAYRVALGEPAGRPADYRVGLRYRWLEGELTAVYNGDLGRLRGAGPRPRIGAMWARDDVRASALLAADAFMRRVRRRVG
jgi:hypothetical protein